MGDGAGELLPFYLKSERRGKRRRKKEKVSAGHSDQHNNNSNTWDIETGGLGVKGHLWLYNKFKSSLGYITQEQKQ